MLTKKLRVSKLRYSVQRQWGVCKSLLLLWKKFLKKIKQNGKNHHLKAKKSVYPTGRRFRFHVLFIFSDRVHQSSENYYVCIQYVCVGANFSRRWNILLRLILYARVIFAFRAIFTCFVNIPRFHYAKKIFCGFSLEIFNAQDNKAGLWNWLMWFWIFPRNITSK